MFRKSIFIERCCLIVLVVFSLIFIFNVLKSHWPKMKGIDLFIACSNGDLEIVKQYIESGSDINWANSVYLRKLEFVYRTYSLKTIFLSSFIFQFFLISIIYFFLLEWLDISNAMFLLKK